MPIYDHIYIVTLLVDTHVLSPTSYSDSYLNIILDICMCDARILHLMYVRHKNVYGKHYCTRNTKTINEHDVRPVLKVYTRVVVRYTWYEAYVENNICIIMIYNIEDCI